MTYHLSCSPRFSKKIYKLFWAHSCNFPYLSIVCVTILCLFVEVVIIFYTLRSIPVHRFSRFVYRIAHNSRLKSLCKIMQNKKIKMILKYKNAGQDAYDIYIYIYGCTGCLRTYTKIIIFVRTIFSNLKISSLLINIFKCTSS